MCSRYLAVLYVHEVPVYSWECSRQGNLLIEFLLLVTIVIKFSSHILLLSVV